MLIIIWENSITVLIIPQISLHLCKVKGGRRKPTATEKVLSKVLNKRKGKSITGKVCYCPMLIKQLIPLVWEIIKS